MNELRPIIVIDDDADDRNLVDILFREIGVKNELVFLKDGAEALIHLREMPSPAALILCDINMPKLSGLELKREINADPKLVTKCVPFFFMTTTVSRHTAEEGYSLGIQGYFVKEGSYDGMRDMLKNVIETSSHGIYPKDFKN